MKQVLSFDAVILGGGDYPTAPLPCGVLEQSHRVVCCDGAADEYILRGHTPIAIVGDGDSLSPANKERFASIFHPVTEQETNDQTKAVNYCLRQGWKRLAIVGGTGKREDHTLGNISLLMDYASQGAEVTMITDYGYFLSVRNNIQLSVKPGTQLSIFNFSATHLQAEGLKYPLYDFCSWWQGTLNEACHEQVSLQGQGDFLIFVATER